MSFTLLILTSELLESADVKPEGQQTQDPLAPPPRPQPTETAPDYFNGSHTNGGSHHQIEPNPFEASFGNPSTDTPGKNLLPPVNALTSPSLLNSGGGTSGGYGWPNSLRAGPLSPAMLTGPTSGSDLFADFGVTGFPTPKESGLRSGLTPGGGGSMFPQPSPNTQALLNSFAGNGVATPNTIEFQRAAMNAATRKNLNSYGLDQSNGAKNDSSLPATTQAGIQQSQAAPEIFGQGDANDAANGLYMLAQQRNSQNSNPYSMSGQASNSIATSGPQDIKPSVASLNNAHVPSISDQSGRQMSEQSDDMSGDSEHAKPATRSRGKKGAKPNARKAEETPSKAPAKKRKGNNGASHMDDLDEDEKEQMRKEEEEAAAADKGKTDEEKRKNFLERNRSVSLTLIA
jgi:ATF/CREB family transcription factor